MSENLTALSFRKGVEQNLFEQMQKASSDPVALRKMSEDCLMGEAVTLGAVSFYDFLKKENREKKVFLCNGSACLCAGTQGPLKSRLEKQFSESEIGEICCLGRCYENGAFQYQGSNYSALEEESIESLFTSGKKAHSKDYHVDSNMEIPLLVAEFPGIDKFYSPFKELVQRDRQSVCEDLKNSGLRGRGGAGFPMGIKVE
ncbi:MAG TPA: formate dehydrogenase, partial [Verrucomicrobia bacterium]|nr:formate dehydrogenase [Verrucomicrobiota bacterium]